MRAWLMVGSLLAACGDAGPTTTVIVGGEDLWVQDVSPDGELIAYTDGDGVLWLVPTEGGPPTQITASADGPVFRATFFRDYLTFYRDRDYDDHGHAVGTMQIVPRGATAGGPPFPGVRMESVRASHDGAHLAFISTTASPTTFSVFLDERLVASGPGHEVRIRFASTSQYLVVSRDLQPGSNQHATVESIPTAGGDPITLVPSGAANRFHIDPSGQQVVIAANENGEIADLTVCPIDAACTSAPLLPQVSDEAFTFLGRGPTLAFLDTNAGLNTIELDGTSRRTTGVGNVVDILDDTEDSVVYLNRGDGGATAGMHHVRVDGTGDVFLSTTTVALGFSPGDTHYLFCAGRSTPLRALGIASGEIFDLGYSCTAAWVASAAVARLDSAARLMLREIGADGALWYADSVSSFAVVRQPDGGYPARGVAYATFDDAPGIYVVELP